MVALSINWGLLRYHHQPCLLIISTYSLHTCVKLILMGQFFAMISVQHFGIVKPMLASAHMQCCCTLQVVTPVRRSARKSPATPLIASMLRETEFAYAPNEALPRRRPSIFESPTLDTEDVTASVQAEDDNASEPTSITGCAALIDVLYPV